MSEATLSVWLCKLCIEYNYLDATECRHCHKEKGDVVTIHEIGVNSPAAKELLGSTGKAPKKAAKGAKKAKASKVKKEAKERKPSSKKEVKKGLSIEIFKGRYLLKLDGETIVEASKNDTIEQCFGAWKARLEKVG